VRSIVCLVVAVAAACAGSSPAQPLAAPPRSTGDPLRPAAPAPSERECDELITHAVKLGIDDQAARAVEPAASQADHEATRRKLHADFVPGCRALARPAYQCAIAATSLAGLAGCQRTASSSTSNSSVAPPGIRPPAPRSP
jgi:hypothetical protein